MAEGQGRRDIGGEKLDARVSALGWEGVAATTTCDLEIVDGLGGLGYADEDVGDVGVWWQEDRGCGWKGGEVESTALWKWGWILGTAR
jgi:hypothetical protein